MSHSTLPNDDPLGDDLPAALLAAVESRTQAVGKELAASLSEAKPHVWQRRWWDERLLAWTMRDEALKVQLFRFVDVLPMLRTPEAVAGGLQEYLETVGDHLPYGARLALRVARRMAFTRAAVARAARLSAQDMARRFIAGENAPQVLSAARRERELQRGFTLDLLGEAVISEREAEEHFQAYLQLLETAAPLTSTWPADPLLDQSDYGPAPRTNLSIKLSALDSQFDPIDPAGTLERVGGRLRELLRATRRLGAFLNVDMESYEKKDLTLAIFQSILSEPEFRDFSDVGIVIQCYLHDAPRDIRRLRDWAAQRGAPVWVRLVKGAYWDYETIRAGANGWPVPVFQEKWRSDACYERVSRFVLQNRQHLHPAFGSHNLRSLAHVLASAELLEIPPSGYELQMLYGMADPEKQAFIDHGQRLRIYMPYGELIPGMAYLVRRLLENTSNQSFLRAGFVERVAWDQLLRNPLDLAAAQKSPKPRESTPTSEASHTSEDRPMPQFVNQPPVDFTRTENREAMQAALAQVRSRFGRHAPLWINNAVVETAERGESRNPSERSQIVGTFALAGAAHADQAVKAASAALPAWRALGVEKRAEILRAAAEAMRGRLFELAAWIVYETGKNWRESTADVDEAIDFCEYYAACALNLQGDGGVDAPGEENRFDYLPRGVTAVIAPWNFPLAILTGMAAAALATGNTVILKPAEQSTITASLLLEIFRPLGLPPGVLQFLPGAGEIVGAALVEHPDVALIAFTGSRAVGLAINAKAAEISQRSSQGVKRVIAEMGGKNAIIVAADADLDEAVLGVMKSAFGYQGQKCSACSRAIVVSDVYDAFLQRLLAAVNSLKLGPADDPSSTIGPVIDDESLARINRYIEIGKTEGKVALAFDPGPLAERGCYAAPHIFVDVSPNARIAQEEIFGPVLAILRAADLTEALQIANSTDYALTGGCFSRSPATLARVRQEFLVGNLYLNRPITGALVHRQPFGGFKMSGIGSKAGGADYLLQFVTPRTITENTMRRGFAPGE